MVGAGARALIERGLASVGREVTPAHLDELFRHFMVHYGQNLCVDSTLFPGVPDALDRLEEAGFRLAVCTNKYENHSVELLESLGIADRFAAICGRDSFPYFKPDPRHLTLTIEKAGGDPARAVMVGDSRTDIATAKAAGMPVGRGDVRLYGRAGTTARPRPDHRPLRPALRGGPGTPDGNGLNGASASDGKVDPVFRGDRRASKRD